MDHYALPQQAHTAQEKETILCCNCGVPITPNPAAMCVRCLGSSHDITSHIQRESSVAQCRDCERSHVPPNQWVAAAWESRELLGLCLKRVRGLERVRLVDAKFRWTEPHSRRIKVQITVQGDVSGAILQQSLEVTFQVTNQQCPECARTFTHHTWKACVQIRQKVAHKRTFLHLEQLVLKHHAHRDALSIKEVKDGLDFYYADKNKALRMVAFLSSVVPMKVNKSEELVTADRKNGIANFKFTFSVEIVPICKDDLVCLPKASAKALGNLPQLVLAGKISNALHFMHPATLQVAEMPAPLYARLPFPAIAESRDLLAFTVLDVEITGLVKGSHAVADIQLIRSSGTADTVLLARSHLGAILQPGDTVLGYHLAVANINDPVFDALDPNHIPDVILVKKSYANRRKKSKARNWKLKSLAADATEEEQKAGGGNKKTDQTKFERDYELFLQELEEDEELRHTVNLYKDVKQDHNQHSKQDKEGGMQMQEDTDDSEAEDDLPPIPMEELLDELDEMSLN